MTDQKTSYISFLLLCSLNVTCTQHITPAQSTHANWLNCYNRHIFYLTVHCCYGNTAILLSLYVAMVTANAAILLSSYVCMGTTVVFYIFNHPTCLSHYADDARVTVRSRPTPNVHRRERRYHVKKDSAGIKLPVSAENRRCCHCFMSLTSTHATQVSQYFI